MSSFQTTYPIRRYIDPFEQLGTYDPFLNRHGEKLCSLNFERINYYLAQGVQVDESVQELLGEEDSLIEHELHEIQLNIFDYQILQAWLAFCPCTPTLTEPPGGTEES